MSLRQKEMYEVINNDTVEYREMFREREVVIPAKGKIMMTRSEATLFKGTHPGYDARKGRDIVKMLEIRPVGNKVQTEPEYISARDGKSFENKEALEAHLLQFKNEIVKDDELDKILEADEKKSQPPVPEALPNGMVACPICQKVVKGKTGLTMHLRSNGCEAVLAKA